MAVVLLQEVQEAITIVQEEVEVAVILLEEVQADHLVVIIQDLEAVALQEVVTLLRDQETHLITLHLDLHQEALREVILQEEVHREAAGLDQAEEEDKTQKPKLIKTIY